MADRLSSQQNVTLYSSFAKDSSSKLEKIETTIKFFSDFGFTRSDIWDDDFADLIHMLIKNHDAYSHHKKYIGKIMHKVHIPRKQRPSKIPVHLKDKLDKMMDELMQAGIVVMKGKRLSNLTKLQKYIS